MAIDADMATQRAYTAYVVGALIGFGASAYDQWICGPDATGACYHLKAFLAASANSSSMGAWVTGFVLLSLFCCVNRGQRARRQAARDEELLQLVVIPRRPNYPCFG